MKTSTTERVDTTVGFLVVVGRECACAAATESYGWRGNDEGESGRASQRRGKVRGPSRRRRGEEIGQGRGVDGLAIAVASALATELLRAPGRKTTPGALVGWAGKGKLGRGWPGWVGSFSIFVSVCFSFSFICLL